MVSLTVRYLIWRTISNPQDYVGKQKVRNAADTNELFRCWIGCHYQYMSEDSYSHCPWVLCWHWEGILRKQTKTQTLKTADTFLQYNFPCQSFFKSVENWKDFFFSLLFSDFLEQQRCWAKRNWKPEAGLLALMQNFNWTRSGHYQTKFDEYLTVSKSFLFSS